MRTAVLNTSSANRRLLNRRQNENRRAPTPAEAHIISLLDALGEQYLFEKGLFTEERFFIVDFYFPKPRKLCLEIDGASHKRSKVYDSKRDAFIRTKRKMRVVRITNEQAMRLDGPALLALLDSGSGESDATRSELR